MMDENSSMSDRRIHVIETSTGTKLTGEDAPLASQLDAWLEVHPGYEVAPRDENGSDGSDESGEEVGAIPQTLMHSLPSRRFLHVFLVTLRNFPKRRHIFTLHKPWF